MEIDISKIDTRIKFLEKERNELLKEISENQPEMAGHLELKSICCGKSNCKCQSGALHGPYWYLYTYEKGKDNPKVSYVGKDCGDYKKAIENHRTNEHLHRQLTIIGQQITELEDMRERIKRMLSSL